MNMEVQHFKHMNEKSSQRGINEFNHQTKLGKRDGFSNYELMILCVYLPLKQVEFQTLFSHILHGNGNVLKSFSYLIWTTFGKYSGQFLLSF